MENGEKRIFTSALLDTVEETSLPSDEKDKAQFWIQRFLVKSRRTPHNHHWYDPVTNHIPIDVDNILLDVSQTTRFLNLPQPDMHRNRKFKYRAAYMIALLNECANIHLTPTEFDYLLKKLTFSYLFGLSITDASSEPRFSYFNPYDYPYQSHIRDPSLIAGGLFENFSTIPKQQIPSIPENKIYLVKSPDKENERKREQGVVDSLDLIRLKRHEKEVEEDVTDEKETDEEKKSRRGHKRRIWYRLDGSLVFDR